MWKLREETNGANKCSASRRFFLSFPERSTLKTESEVSDPFHVVMADELEWVRQEIQSEQFVQRHRPANDT